MGHDRVVSTVASSRRVAALVLLPLCLAALACAGRPRVDDDALIHGLDDPHWQIRASAAEELGRRGAAGVAPRLGRALSDRSEEVRAAAVSSLGRLGAKSELEGIRALIDEEEDPQVEVLALFALADLAAGESGRELKADLKRLDDKLDDDNRRVNRAARRVIRKLADPERAEAVLLGPSTGEGGSGGDPIPVPWRYDRIEDRISLARNGECTLTRTFRVRGDGSGPISRVEAVLPEPFQQVDRVADAEGGSPKFELDWDKKSRVLRIDFPRIDGDETATFTVTSRSFRPLFQNGSAEAAVVYSPGSVEAPVKALHVEMSLPAGTARVIEPSDLQVRAGTEPAIVTLDRADIVRGQMADLVVRVGLPASALSLARTPPRATTRNGDLALIAGIVAAVLGILTAVILWLCRARGALGHRAILAAVLTAGAFLFLSPSLIEDNLPYYALARSAVFDGDLDRTNEFTEFNQTQAYAPDPRGALDPVFGSFFGTPFLVAARGLTSAVNAVSPVHAPNGFSFPYLYATALGDFLAVLIGCLACFSLVERRVGGTYALFAVSSIVGGTNLLLFAYAWTGSSFQPSFLVFAVFLDHWDKTRERRTPAGWLGAGLLLGLLVMTRTLNATFLLIPLLDWLVTATSRAREKGVAGLARPFRDGAILTAGVVLGDAPQFLLQRLVDHTWFVDAYGVGSGRFTGFRENLWGLLVSRATASSFDGLLPAMPVLVLAFAGLIALIRWDRRLGLVLGATLALQLVAIGSYEVYWGYFKYGTPYLVPSAPILCLAMGSLMKAVHSRWPRRGPVLLWALALPLVARNAWCVLRQVASDTMSGWDPKLDVLSIVHSTLLLDRKLDIDVLRMSGDVACLLRETVGALRARDLGQLLAAMFWTVLLLLASFAAYFVWSRRDRCAAFVARPGRRRVALVALGLVGVGVLGWLAALGAATDVDYRFLSTRQTAGRRELKLLRIEPGKSLTVPLALRNAASGVTMITFLDGATDVPQNAPVATVEFDPAWSKTRFDLRAGIDTADFAVDRPETRTPSSHRAPLERACFSWRVRDDSSHFYTARAYASAFDTRNPGAAGTMTVTSSLDRGTLLVVMVNVFEPKLPKDAARRRWLADRW